MHMPLKEVIIPLSELRTNLNGIKKKLKNSPVIITLNGRPDFGICDLETLELAFRIKDFKNILQERIANRANAIPAEKAFNMLDKKFGLKS